MAQIDDYYNQILSKLPREAIWAVEDVFEVLTSDLGCKFRERYPEFVLNFGRPSFEGRRMTRQYRTSYDSRVHIPQLYEQFLGLLDSILQQLPQLATERPFADICDTPIGREARKVKAEELLKEQRQLLLDFIDNKLLTSFLVIDSNIWMSQDYDGFFQTLEQQLKKHSKELVINGTQFDEIDNIKNTTNGEKGKEEKNKEARKALWRIENLSVQNLLRVESITAAPARKAYADPSIIDLLVKVAKSKPDVVICLLTDDISLRTRAREHLKNFDAEYLIVGGDIVKRINELENYLNRELWKIS